MRDCDHPIHIRYAVCKTKNFSRWKSSGDFSGMIMFFHLFVNLSRFLFLFLRKYCFLSRTERMNGNKAYKNINKTWWKRQWFSSENSGRPIARALSRRFLPFFSQLVSCIFYMLQSNFGTKQILRVNDLEYRLNCQEFFFPKWLIQFLLEVFLDLNYLFKQIIESCGEILEKKIKLIFSIDF